MELERTDLCRTLAGIFAIRGLAPGQAERLAGELADATFAGYESHGIGRVKGYVEALEAGRLRADARLTVVRETPATALADAGQGLGILMGLEAAELAAAKARQSGLGAVAVRNCGDVARLAPYAEQMARLGCIGLAAANDAGAGQVVAPHGGSQPVLSTNPLAAGLPRPGKRPLVFDMATSQIALGAVRAASRREAAVPGDTLVAADGQPTADPQALFAGLAALLPLGGAAFGFKGTALGLLVDVLAGGLSGDGFSGDHPDRSGRNALFLLALDPGAFTDPADFQAGLERLLDRLRNCPPRPGLPAVRIPGEQPPPGDRIQVLDALWAELEALRKA